MQQCFRNALQNGGNGSRDSGNCRNRGTSVSITTAVAQCEVTAINTCRAFKSRVALKLLIKFSLRCRYIRLALSTVPQVEAVAAVADVHFCAETETSSNIKYHELKPVLDFKHKNYRERDRVVQ